MNNARRWPVALTIACTTIALVIGLLPARAQDATPATTIHFEGGGWGHGVGMSQYGAFGRAASGDTHADILSFYYPGSELTVVDAPDDMRIHLHSAAGTIVDPSGNIELVAENGDVLFSHNNGKPLTVRKINDSFTVRRPGGRNICLDDDDVDRCEGREIRLRFVQGEPVKVDAIDRISVGTTGNRYQWGELVISERTFDSSGETLWVVLENLTMDQYLYGLAEVPASWPSEVLKTQAVAARTYAFDRATNRRANPDREEPWDLFSTVDDQVYHGYEKESSSFSEAWTAAVDATSDEVSLHDGEPITAFYSSSNGGWTEDSGYVFVTSLPYLVAQRDREDDHQNPYDRWSRDYTGEELGAWLANSSIGGVGTVLDVRLSGNIGRSGRVDRATVTIIGTQGTVTTTGSRFRIAVNSGVARAGGGLSRQLLSTKFDVTVLGGADPVGAVDRVKRRTSDNTARVVGWVFDPDFDASIDVDIYVDDQRVETVTADGARFDIDAAFSAGHARGYDTRIPLSGGAHQVCVYVDSGAGGERLLLGCQVA